MVSASTPFWLSKSLQEMTREEWESLCDGCGRCCLIKLEDEDTLELYYTNIVCRHLDCAGSGACHCSIYEQRKSAVPTCLVMTPEHLEVIDWAPNTCAYRLLHHGHDLPAWHPLISGDPASVQQAGISVRGRVVSEDQVNEEELEDHIVDWVSHEWE